MISCSIKSHETTNELPDQNALLDHKQNNLNIEIKIKNQDTSKIKLVIIPPDSGFWILNNDTIHLDSL